MNSVSGGETAKKSECSLTIPSQAEVYDPEDPNPECYAYSNLL